MKEAPLSGICTICGNRIEWFNHQATSYRGNTTVVLGNLAHSISRQPEDVVEVYLDEIVAAA